MKTSDADYWEVNEKIRKIKEKRDKLMLPIQNRMLMIFNPKTNYSISYIFPNCLNFQICHFVRSRHNLNNKNKMNLLRKKARERNPKSL